ncbi:MAG: Crp/Fnr family transcriptional regulator [Mycobacteriales bacterium]
MDDSLRRVSLFSGLDDDSWKSLRSRLKESARPRGTLIFAEGDAGGQLHVILSGKVKISRAAVDGRENLLAVLGPGDLFGELSLFNPGPRTATATTITDAQLATFSHDDLRPVIIEQPEVAAELLRVLAERLRQTNDAMADLVFTDVPGRVAKALLSLAERFGETDPDGVRVHHDLTQEELAQLVGASRETVNKALSDFAGRGWLRVDARAVVLLDLERLRRRAR